RLLSAYTAVYWNISTLPTDTISVSLLSLGFLVKLLRRTSSSGRPRPKTFCTASTDSVAYFFFQAEDGIRDWSVTGVQTCALPIPSRRSSPAREGASTAHPRPNRCSRRSRGTVTPRNPHRR